MDILTAVGYLLLGFFILIIGGEFLVRAAISLAVRLKVNPTLIGLTIIAAGTSAPEFMTTLLATLKGSPDIAVGNVIGSNIFNILAIIGISCLIKPNRIDKSMARYEVPALIVFSFMLLIFSYDSILSRSDGIIFLVTLVIFLYIAIRRSKLYPTSANSDDDDINVLKHWALDITYLIFGFVGLLYGAEFALEGGVSIGRTAGLSERIIGLTIISVGTGLPELATSAIAAYRGRDDIAIANVIGSNIMNTLLVLGSASTIQAVTISPKILSFDLKFMLASTLVLAPIIFITKFHIGRKTGALLLSFYLFYIALLINLH